MKIYKYFQTIISCFVIALVSYYLLNQRNITVIYSLMIPISILVYLDLLFLYTYISDKKLTLLKFIRVIINCSCFFILIFTILLNKLDNSHIWLSMVILFNLISVYISLSIEKFHIYNYQTYRNNKDDEQKMMRKHINVIVICIVLLTIVLWEVNFKRPLYFYLSLTGFGIINIIYILYLMIKLRKINWLKKVESLFLIQVIVLIVSSLLIIVLKDIMDIKNPFIYTSTLIYLITFYIVPLEFICRKMFMIKYKNLLLIYSRKK